MEKSTSGKIKLISKILILLILIIVLLVLIIVTTDNKYIKNIKEFTSEGTKVLYITNKNKYSKYIVDLLEKYDAKYMYIDSSNLSNIEKNKLVRIVDNNDINNLIAIFENGEIKETLIDDENQNDINKFLQNNNIIPEIIGDNKNIISSVENLLKTEFTLIYIPYKYIDLVAVQDEILKNISEKYNINYEMINAYLLSDVQKEKLNSLLDISMVEDQIVILVSKEKIVGNIRGEQTTEEFINKLYELDFIKEEENKLNEITEEEFDNILNLKDKSIVFIKNETCKYCSDIEKKLNEIVEEYGIIINYINLGEVDSDLSKNIESKLKVLGQDVFSPPMTIIIESGKILNNIIGSSNKEYFVDIFSINGIIK